MRDILLRAWHRHKKQMMLFTLGELNDSMITKVDDGWYLEDCEIMQGIGATDRHGTQIYLGDILEDPQTAGVFPQNDRWEVEYVEDEVWSIGLSPLGDVCCPWCADTLREKLAHMEIIGNIWENSDLLIEKEVPV